MFQEGLARVSDPLQSALGAIRSGEIPGGNLSAESLKWIRDQAQSLADLTRAETIHRLDRSMMPRELKEAVIRKSVDDRLTGVGFRKPGEAAASRFGGFVRSPQNNNVTVQIGSVNVSRPEDARRTGESLGRGLVKSFDLAN